MATEQHQPTLGSLFDGVGAFPRVAQMYEFRSVWASKIVPQAVNVTIFMKGIAECLL